MSDKPLKSAVELAMERFGAQTQPLTDQQKAAIAEVRNFYEAKLAEQDVLYRSRLPRVTELSEREALEQEFRRDRERLTSERDRKIEKIRNQA